MTRATAVAKKRQPLTAAQRELVEAHVGWALGVARSVARRCWRMVEEFESGALDGLVHAARRYDPARHAEFRAFAYPRVRGAIVDGARDLMPKGFRRAGSAAIQVGSLSAPLRLKEGWAAGDGRGRTLGHVIADRRPGPGADLEADDEFEDICRRLKPQHAAVVRAYFSREPQTLKQIGDALGLSESRVSQLLRQILGDLRERLAHTKGGMA